MGLITDVMTSNCQMTAKSRAGKDYRVSAPFRQAPPHYSDAQRKEWIFERGKLTDMHVYIGFHSGVLGLNPDVNTVDYAVLSLGIATEPRPPKKVLTTIGNLAVCIWMGEDPPSVPSSFRDLAVDQNWDWPGVVPHVSYDDFFGLYEQDPYHVALIRLLSDPERCQQVEAYSRQKGYSDIPPALAPLFKQMIMQATVARALWRRGA